MQQSLEDELFQLVLGMVDEHLICRVSMKQTKTYLAIVFDNNTHRTVCRMYLSQPVKLIGVMNLHKVETKYPFRNAGEIAKYSSEIKMRARNFS